VTRLSQETSETPTIPWNKAAVFSFEEPNISMPIEDQSSPFQCEEHAVCVLQHSWIMQHIIVPRTNCEPTYCNGFDQRVARQQLCKHGPTHNNNGGCVFCVHGDVTQRWVVVMWCVSCDACPFLGYVSDRIRLVQGRVSSR
jgi:hypothetical protein